MLLVALIGATVAPAHGFEPAPAILAQPLPSAPAGARPIDPAAPTSSATAPDSAPAVADPAATPTPVAAPAGASSPPPAAAEFGALPADGLAPAAPAAPAGVPGLPADDGSAPVPVVAPGAEAAPAATGTASEGADPAAGPAGDAPAESPGAGPAPVPGDIWERIRRGFAMPELRSKLADNRTRWYANQPDYIDRMATRASRYLFHIVEEIEKRGMPTELALLPFVESAMQPEAVSSAKAAGLWQFIPSTGRLYELEQSLWADERRDVIESTRAALDYLQKLHDDFGDWHLALAAYNCGEGGVGRALARNRARRKPLDYSSLPLPRETRYYVPKLQAIKNIVLDPARHGITLPEIRNEPYFVALIKERDIDVATAARLAEMPIEEFRALNPAFNRPVIVGAAAHNILLPADRATVFHANLAAWESTGQPLASWTTHQLAAGESLAKVAARVGLSEAQLREANRVPPRYRLAPGSTILIPRDETMGDDIAPESLRASFALVPERADLRRVTYRVRRGDTLAGVARRWRVSPEDIVAWNDLRSPRLFAGQRLSLTVVRAAPAARRAPARRATRTVVADAAARATASAAARR